MTDDQHLADLRERFGPDATRVGDPPTAADVALLLRMIAELEAVVSDARDVGIEIAEAYDRMDTHDMDE